MKTIRISDELFQKLRNFIVDPFDDTPETVVGRLIDIACKAQSRWTPWDQAQNASGDDQSVRRPRVARPVPVGAEDESVEDVVVL